ncbi:MAG: hypothetical protein M1114_03060 [Candidatus Dependentiae bacterium]|nr:hypothetical protein [Candidatus Dependentiae bacterium]
MKKIILVTSVLTTLFGTCFGMDPFQQGYYSFPFMHPGVKVFTPRILYPIPSVPGLSHQAQTEKSPLEFLATTAQQTEPVIVLPTPSSTAASTLQPNSAQPPIDKTIAKQLAYLHQSSTQKTTSGMKTISRSQFKCDACNFEIDNEIGFTIHQLSYAHKVRTGLVTESSFNKYKFKCYDCMFGFTSEEKLDIHRASKDHRKRVGLPPLKWNEKKYRCNMCRKGFCKEQSLISHLSLSNIHKKKRRQTVIKIK